MVEAVCKSFNHLNDNPERSFSEKKDKDKNKKQSQQIDDFPEITVLNKQEKFEEQLELIHKIQELEKQGCKATEYLKRNIDRSFHMINITVPDDIIISKRPKPEIDILA